MRPVSITVEHVARVAPSVCFDAIIPVDLSRIFTGYGPLPAVTGTRGQVGDWDAQGNSRTVELTGGGSMVERLTDVRRPDVCAYEVRPVRGPLTLAVDHIDGQFAFSPEDGGATRITWTYSFVARRRWRAALLLGGPLWRRYARRVLARAAEVAEQAGSAMPAPRLAAAPGRGDALTIS